MAWRTVDSFGSWTEVASDDPDTDVPQALALDGSWLWSLGERTVLVRNDQLQQLAGGVLTPPAVPRPMPQMNAPELLVTPGQPAGEPWVKVAATLAGADPLADPGDLVFDKGGDLWYSYAANGTWKPLGGAGAVSPLTLTATTAAETPLTLVGAAGQTADLVNIKDSGGVRRFSVDAGGRPYLGANGNFGGGTGPMLFLGDDTSDPTGNPVGGIIIYSRSGGTLRARHPNGATMTLAPTLSTTANELVLEQTGDSFGASRLHMQNRAGSAGALFENTGLDLVDFAFKPQVQVASNMRLEGRGSSYQDPSNTAGEFQFLMQAAGGICHVWHGNTGSGILGRYALGAAKVTWGGGAGPMLYLANDTSDPSTNPVGGGIIYCSAGALKYRGTSGTVTQLAPP